MTLTADFFATFTEEWIAAWNAHDLERILALYEDDFTFTSPVLAKVMPDSGGHLIGKDAARAYWSKAFAPGVDLVFEHIATMAGVGSAVIHYRGRGGRLCAEWFRFSADGKVAASAAHEAPAPTNADPMR